MSATAKHVVNTYCYLFDLKVSGETISSTLRVSTYWLQVSNNSHAKVSIRTAVKLFVMSCLKLYCNKGG
jgi:hypothetical protein